MELPTCKTVLCLLRFRKRLTTAEIIKYGMAYCNNGNTTKAELLEGISCLVSIGLVKRITANRNKKEPFEECKEDDDAEYELTGTSNYKWLESDTTCEEETETTLSKFKQNDSNSLLPIKEEKDMVYGECQQYLENHLMISTHALVGDSKLKNTLPDESKQEEAVLFDESKQDVHVSLNKCKQGEPISLDESQEDEPVGKKIKYHSQKKKLLAAKNRPQKCCINTDIKGVKRELCYKKRERKIKRAVRGQNNRVKPVPKKLAMGMNSEQQRIIENFRAVMKKGKQFMNVKKPVPKKKANAKCQQNKCVMKMCNQCKKIKVYIKKAYGTGKFQTYRVIFSDEIDAEDKKTNEIYNRLFGDTKLDSKPINKRKLVKKIKETVNLRKRPHVMCNENGVMKVLHVHCYTPEDDIYLNSVPVPKKKKKLC